MCVTRQLWSRSSGLAKLCWTTPKDKKVRVKMYFPSLPPGASSHCLLSGKSGWCEAILTHFHLIQPGVLFGQLGISWLPHLPGKPFPLAITHQKRSSLQVWSSACGFLLLRSCSPKHGSSVLQKPLRCCILFNASALALGIGRRMVHAGNSKCRDQRPSKEAELVAGGGRFAPRDGISHSFLQR